MEPKTYSFEKDKGIIEGLWCRDSETGEELLIDLRTSTILAYRENGKIIDPADRKAK